MMSRVINQGKATRVLQGDNERPASHPVFKAAHQRYWAKDHANLGQPACSLSSPGQRLGGEVRWIKSNFTTCLAAALISIQTDM